MRRAHIWLNETLAVDKLLHHMVSFALTMTGFIISPITGILVGIIAGFAKEFSDMFNFNKWSWGDVFFNLLGVADAVLIYYLLNQDISFSFINNLFS